MQRLIIDRATYASLSKPPATQLALPFAEISSPLPIVSQPTAAISAGRKKPCMVKLTQEDHDTVCELYQQRNAYNMQGNNEKRYDTQMLTDRLNEYLGANKSVSVYSKIWRGVISREQLPSREELNRLEGQK